MAVRLLLIEDDASIARFIELAVEELPGPDGALVAVELVIVPSLATAREALARGGWQLVISDLMLPDGSAETLLDDGLARAPGAPPWVVFSAGVSEAQREALQARGAACVLRKPVPLGELLSTLTGLLGSGAPEATAPPPASEPDAGPDPVAAHFGGDRVLFESFRAGCLQRFADDLAQGDAAQAAGDVATLRRVAHGLKAVLELLGQPALAAQARALENACAAHPGGAPLPVGWPALSQGVAALGVVRRP